MTAYIIDRPILCKHLNNRLPVTHQYFIFCTTTLAATEHHSFGLSQRQRLAGTHRDQVAFDLGHQSECKAQNLAVDRIVECISLLGRVKIDSFLQTFAHDRHHIRKGAAQPRDLGDDERIAPFHAPQQRSQFTIPFALFPLTISVTQALTVQF